MKTKILLCILALVLCAVPAFGQDTTTPNTVSFNGFSFSFSPTLAENVNISQVAGTEPGVMSVDAPHTQFVLYNGETMPEMFDVSVAIHVYKTSEFTGLDTVQAEFQQLQGLLASREDLTPYVTVTDIENGDPELPFLPLANAAQVLRAQAQYVDLVNIQGIRYLSVYRQDVSPFTSGEFVYTFQGLSTDGLYYVSASFRVNTDLFPAELPADFDYDAFTAGYLTYLTESSTQLNQANAASFTPSLSEIEAVIQSFAFGMTAMPNPDPVAATPTATSVTAATEVNQDQTLGGLAGTWNLVSYGPVEAQQPVLPNAPITLIVDSTGVTGSAGCNSYGGAFQYNGLSVTFTNIVSTLMACEEPISAQESAYLATLTTATSFQINGGQLVITTPTGVLTFINAAAAILTPTVEMTATATIEMTAVPVVPTATETATTTP